VRLWVVGAALGQAQTLVHRQVWHDRFRNVRRDHVFEIENVCKLLVKLSGPRRSLIPYVEQLNRHADTFGRASDPAVENKSNPELAPGAQRIRVSSVTQNAAGWSNSKRAYRTQSCD